MTRIEVVVAVGSALRLFGSLEAAEQALDPAAVRAEGTAIAFDRTGAVLRVQVLDNGWGQEFVRLAPAAGEVPRPRELHDRLAALLRSSGVAVRPADDLAGLLRRAEPLCRR